MKNICIAIFTFCTMSSYAQTETISPIKISGYLETYYSYDFGNPADHSRPGFMYSFGRHNEVTLNVGILKAAYETQQVRANLALMTGTYSNTNLAAEPSVLKNIYEANAGVKLSKTKNLWIDAGIFSSHIGFESAMGAVCWNLTRSILAENSPYFETGVKLSYTSDNEKWFISGLVLNGWQRMQRVDGNNTPAFGHQLTFQPNSAVTLNSSSFIGSDTPDYSRQMRYFHNLFAQIQFNEKTGIIAGFDIGAQQQEKGSSDYNLWYAPVLIAKYSPIPRVSIAARAEYYNDRNGVIISTETANGFQTFGYSLNVDYNIADNAVWRIESRALRSKDKIFNLDDQSSTQNYFVTTALAISF